MSQIDHLLQTAEAIRRDGKPEWMQVRIIILNTVYDTYHDMPVRIVNGSRA